MVEKPKTLADKLFKVCWVSLFCFVALGGLFGLLFPNTEKLDPDFAKMIGVFAGLLLLVVVSSGIGSAVAFFLKRRDRDSN